jgi:DNA-binding transcriptional ArsR family regulator
MQTVKDSVDAPSLDQVLPSLEELRRLGAALGDLRRCRLLYELHHGPQAVHELVERTGFRQPLVSHHLGVLRRVGLVRDVPDGRLRLYRLEEHASGAALALLELFRSRMEPGTGTPPTHSGALGSAQERREEKAPTPAPSPAGGTRSPGSQIEDYLL